MKKIFLIIIFLLSFSLFAQPKFVLAAAASNSVAPTVTPTILNTVNYTLPYPGILPNNPLYIFKVIRDAVIGFLISDPLKKAKFDLLQADKRLNMGLYLSHQGNQDKLISDSVSKAENYFAEGIGQMRQAKSQGQAIGDTLNQFKLAAQKHREELFNLQQTASFNLRKNLTLDQARVEDFAEELGKLHSK